ncbi:MAG TPA: hypothetical protein VFT51_03825 [Bacillales bacterium]|nr:hypothetical protein [Bacillales bacterium]
MNRLGGYWLFPAAAVIAALIIGSYSLLLLAVIWSVVLFVGMLILRTSDKRSNHGNRKIKRS